MARKGEQRVQVSQLYEYGKNTSPDKLLKSCQFLRRELPVRLAKRIMDFQALPFIVVCNPHIKHVFIQYVKAFNMLKGMPKVEDLDDEVAYTEVLKGFIDDHQSVIDRLAQGCRTSRAHCDPATLNAFISRTITSRVGIRLLVEQQVALHARQPGRVGIFSTDVSAETMVRQCSFVVRDMCQRRYGQAPKVNIVGDTELKFRYVEAHIEYIMLELLKNSMRATAEFHDTADTLPAIEVRIVDAGDAVFIKVSDYGGGYSDEVARRIWEYSYTTVDESAEDPGVGFDFGTAQEPNNIIAGLGFGLPMSKVYAEHFGGSLQLVSMLGYGTDAYLRLSRLDHPTHANIRAT